MNGVKSPPFIILMSSVKAHSWSDSLPGAILSVPGKDSRSAESVCTTVCVFCVVLLSLWEVYLVCLHRYESYRL